jgi:hypothetical protein
MSRFCVLYYGSQQFFNRNEETTAMCYKLSSMIPVLAVVLAAGQAAADVVFTSRYSMIEAFGAVNNEWTEEDVYDDLDEIFSGDAFSGTVSGDASVTNHSVGSEASQTSGLTIVGGLLQEASASGSTMAYQSDGTGSPAGGGYAFGDSLFSIFFEVTDVPAPYRLAGAISSYGTTFSPTQNFAEVVLYDSDTMGVIESWFVGDGSALGFDVGGSLLPGSYKLDVTAHSSTSGPTTNGTGYDVTLTVPEPGTSSLLGILGVCLGGYVCRKRKQ